MLNYEWYTLPDYTYRKYISSVKNNEFTTHEQAERKLNRNLRLAIKTFDGYLHEDFWYGSLYLRCKNGVIITIENKKKIPEKVASKVKSWKLNAEKYNKLNEKFGIY